MGLRSVSTRTRMTTDGGMDRSKANAQQHPPGGRSATRRYLGSCPTGASSASRDELPQLPGMTPDQPALPGRSRGSSPPLASNRRPLAEYGSAQRLLGLFTPAPGSRAASVGLGARSLGDGRVAQGRPGAADADPTTHRRWPRDRSLDVRHRRGGSRGDWRRDGSDDRGATPHRGSDRGAFVPGRHPRITRLNEGYRCS